MLNLENIDISKILFLSGLVCTNEHEIMGYFNIRYQNYLNKDKVYDASIVDKNQRSGYADNIEGEESGEKIEINLYGRIINNLTLNEAIFILDIRNYFCDFNSFRKNFQKCNNKKLVIDEFLKNYLKISFDINVENLPINDNISYNLGNEIKKYNLNENVYFNQTKGKHPNNFDMDDSKIEGKIKEFKEFEEYLNKFN